MYKINPIKKRKKRKEKKKRKDKQKRKERKEKKRKKEKKKRKEKKDRREKNDLISEFRLTAARARFIRCLMALYCFSGNKLKKDRPSFSNIMQFQPDSIQASISEPLPPH